MSGPSKSSFANPTPYQLHSLVMDYLCHSCYTRTAAAFNKDNPSRQLNADGDEVIGGTSGNSSDKLEGLLNQVKLRQEIQTQILSGRVDDAIALLNTHFPSVLAENAPAAADSALSEPRPSMSNLEYVSSTSTEPEHLVLNLRILAFSEACRTVPLEYPPKAEMDTSESDDDTSMSVSAEPDVEDTNSLSVQQQIALLTRAQKLYAYSKTLPNPTDQTTYLKELENVSGLLAYTEPEKSTMAKYLTMERREAVADQINRAILKRTGRPLISTLELITRQTSTAWQYANQLNVKARPGIVLPPKNSKTPSSMEADHEVVPTFDLQQFLDAKP